MVFKRSEWNEIIQDINDLATNPDPGCEAIDPLEEVGPNHRWAKSDVRDAQDKLIEICPENEFGTIPDLWKQSIIDELNTAINNGWCECEICQADDEEFNLFEVVQECTFGGLLSISCEGGSSTPPSEEWFPNTLSAGNFDWYEPATEATGFGPGIGGEAIIHFETYGGEPGNEELLLSRTPYRNDFGCNGEQVTPFPERPELSDGTLQFSSWTELIEDGVNCTEYERVCIINFCFDLKCVLGLPACNGQDGSDIDALLAAKEEDCSNVYRRRVWTLEKRVPSAFRTGAPCFECCPGDPTGFVGIDCETGE